jgi:RNA polymerase sigma factor CnrH
LTPEEPSDAELVLRTCNGDSRAFTLLMRRHKGWLYKFVRRHVGDAEEAYDLVQESFTAAWSALGRYDPERPFGFWLRRIALNKCRDRGRRHAVRRAVMGLVRGEPDRIDVPDPRASADALTAADQALRRLDAALAALPAQLKEPLILTAIEGLSHKEAAEVLGTNAKAVETRIYRAKKRLAEVLDPADLGEIIGRG